MLGNSDKNNKVIVENVINIFDMSVINILIISNIFFVQNVPRYDQILLFSGRLEMFLDNYSIAGCIDF